MDRRRNGEVINNIRAVLKDNPLTIKELCDRVNSIPPEVVRNTVSNNNSISNRGKWGHRIYFLTDQEAKLYETIERRAIEEELTPVERDFLEINKPVFLDKIDYPCALITNMIKSGVYARVTFDQKSRVKTYTDKVLFGDELAGRTIIYPINSTAEAAKFIIKRLPNTGDRGIKRSLSSFFNNNNVPKDLADLVKRSYSKYSSEGIDAQILEFMLRYGRFPTSRELPHVAAAVSQGNYPGISSWAELRDLKQPRELTEYLK